MPGRRRWILRPWLEDPLYPLPASFHLGHLDPGVAVVVAGLEDRGCGLDMEIAARQLDGVHRRGDDVAVSHPALELIVLPRVIHDHLARTYRGRHLGADEELADIVVHADEVVVLDPPLPRVQR